MPELLGSLLDAEIRLTPRPNPVPGDLRVSWGIALIVLLLGSSRAKKASFPKLHLLAHSSRTEHGRRTLTRYVETRSERDKPLIRVEPWLNRAIGFATAEGLVAVTKGKSAALTPRGEHFFAALRGNTELMREEQEFAAVCARRLTEGDVNQFLRRET
jgi:hypothetical protein